MITPYFGEFLLSVPPLELSMNYCSHKCAYCFANLNKPDRKAAPQTMISLLADFQNRDTITAILLKEKYPVLISNKVDPFSHSNYRLTLQTLEILAALGIPVAFQTKGGIGLEEALDFINPSCFYFSLTCQDDETAKRIEPGAPSMTERFRQIALLQSRGHHVWAGVNPLVRAWIPDVDEFCKRLAGAGIKQVWSEVLHLTGDQIKNMNPREKEAIGDSVMNEALKKNFPKEVVDHEFDLIDACKENGISFGCKHWPEANTVLDAYHRCYPKMFPSMTDFTTHACRTMKVGDEITFNDFKAFMLPYLPDVSRRREMQSYIFSCNRKLGKENATDSGMVYEDILRVIWIHRDHRMNPRRSFAFKKVKIGDMDGEPIYKEDSEGLPVIYFTGKKLERR